MPRPVEAESWGHSTVQTACPLDCPDSCTLEVTVENGRIVKIDGGQENPSTRGFICAKVRRFADRVYGEDRLLYPAIRKGPKGDGVFTRVSWDEALDHIAERMTDDSRPLRWRGDPAVLVRRLERAAHAGHQRCRAVARVRHVAPRAHGLRGADRRGQPGPLWQDARRHLPGLRARAADRPLGREPVDVGHPPHSFIKEARKAGAQLVVIDPRATSLARQADLHLALRPGTDLPVALALHKYLFDSGHADLPFLAEHARGVDELRARADRVDDGPRGRGRRRRSRAISNSSPSSTPPARRP